MKRVLSLMTILVVLGTAGVAGAQVQTTGSIQGRVVDADGAFWRGSIVVLAKNNVLEAAHHVPAWVKGLPLAVGAVGTAWMLREQRPGATAVPVPADWALLPDGARSAVAAAVEACRAEPDDPATFALLGRIYHGNA